MINGCIAENNFIRALGIALLVRSIQSPCERCIILSWTSEVQSEKGLEVVKL